MSIVAIDPGTAHTGIVYMDERRIIDAITLPGKGAPTIRRDQRLLHDRSCRIARGISAYLAGKEREAVVIESFAAWDHSQGPNSHQTPILVGHIMQELAEENLVIQTSDVLRVQKGSAFDLAGVIEEAKALKRGGASSSNLKRWLVESAMADASKCTNDHLRSAAVHGMYYYASKAANHA